jgi:hypothetical protein
MSNDLENKITSDMVVIDDRLAGELVLTPEKGMKQAVFRTRPGDIKDLSARINRVLLDANQDTN